MTDELEALAGRDEMLAVMRDLFENPEFQVGIGGNPNRVEALIARARAAIAAMKEPDCGR